MADPLRWLDEPFRLRALRACGVPAHASPRATYVRVRPGETAIVAFEVLAADGTAASAYVRLPLSADAAAEASALADKWTRLHAVPAPADLGAGVRALADLSGVLFFFPNDAGLRDLKDVVDLDKLKRACGDLPAFAGNLRIKGSGATLTPLRWKPERRFVARYDAKTRTPDDRAGPPIRAIVRFFPDDRGARLDALVRTLRAAPEPPATPTPLGCAMEGRLYVESCAPGESLLAALERDGDAQADACADAVVKLHAAAVAGLPSAPDLRDEADDAARAIAAAAPALAARAGDVAAAVRRLLPTDGPRGPIHGDLHPGQWIVSESGATLVDFERVAAGDPFLDVGNLVVEVALLARLAPRSAAPAFRFLLRFLATAAERGGSRDPRAVHLFAAGAALRRAAVPFRRAETDAAASAEKLLATAEASLKSFRGADDDHGRPAPLIDPVSATTAACRSFAEAASAGPAQAAVVAPPVASVEPGPAWEIPFPCTFATDDPALRCGLWDPQGGAPRVVPPASDPALPAFAEFAARGELLARRAGRSATFRVASGDGPVLVRLLPRLAAARAAAAQEVALAALRGGTDPDLPRVARLAFFDPERPALGYEPLPGATLRERLARGDASAREAVRRAARALAAWQRLPVVPPRLSPVGPRPTSASQLERLEAIARAAHAPCAGFDPAPFHAALAALPAEPPASAETLVHGACDDASVLVADDGACAFVGLERLHHGDPARDPGDLAAAIVAVCAAQGATDGPATARAFLSAYADAGGVATHAAVAASAARASFAFACAAALSRPDAPAARAALDAAVLFAAEAR